MSDKKNGNDSAVGSSSMCKVKACKHQPSKYSFCKEHFSQFKFGLITKMGEMVSDHEKKLDQYIKWCKTG
jgi:hypothetical protein